MNASSSSSAWPFGGLDGIFSFPNSSNSTNNSTAITGSSSLTLVVGASSASATSAANSKGTAGEPLSSPSTSTSDESSSSSSLSNSFTAPQTPPRTATTIVQSPLRPQKSKVKLSPTPTTPTTTPTTAPIPTATKRNYATANIEDNTKSSAPRHTKKSLIRSKGNTSSGSATSSTSNTSSATGAGCPRKSKVFLQRWRLRNQSPSSRSATTANDNSSNNNSKDKNSTKQPSVTCPAEKEKRVKERIVVQNHLVASENNSILDNITIRSGGKSNSKRRTVSPPSFHYPAALPSAVESKSSLASKSNSLLVETRNTKSIDEKMRDTRSQLTKNSSNNSSNNNSNDHDDSKKASPCTNTIIQQLVHSERDHSLIRSLLRQSSKRSLNSKNNTVETKDFENSDNHCKNNNTYRVVIQGEETQLNDNDDTDDDEDGIDMDIEDIEDDVFTRPVGIRRGISNDRLYSLSHPAEPQSCSSVNSSDHDYNASYDFYSTKKKPITSAEKISINNAVWNDIGSEERQLRQCDVPLRHIPSVFVKTNPSMSVRSAPISSCKSTLSTRGGNRPSGVGKVGGSSSSVGSGRSSNTANRKVIFHETTQVRYFQRTDEERDDMRKHAILQKKIKKNYKTRKLLKNKKSLLNSTVKSVETMLNGGNSNPLSSASSLSSYAKRLAVHPMPTKEVNDPNVRAETMTQVNSSRCINITGSVRCGTIHSTMSSTSSASSTSSSRHGGHPYKKDELLLQQQQFQRHSSSTKRTPSVSKQQQAISSTSMFQNVIDDVTGLFNVISFSKNDSSSSRSKYNNPEETIQFERQEGYPIAEKKRKRPFTSPLLFMPTSNKNKNRHAKCETSSPLFARPFEQNCDSIVDADDSDDDDDNNIHGECDELAAMFSNYFPTETMRNARQLPHPKQLPSKRFCMTLDDASSKTAGSTIVTSRGFLQRSCRIGWNKNYSDDDSDQESWFCSTFRCT